ncbi:hypothetical protein ACP70R_014520 [Stipagrostis hirtigluma subsp. patula]
MADGIDDDAWVYVLSPDEESNSDDEESLHSCTDAMSYEAVATTSDDGDGDASSQDNGGAGTEDGEARSEPDGGGGFYGSTEVDDFLYLLDQEAAGKGDAPTDGGDAVVVDAGAAAAAVKIDGDSVKAAAAEEHGGDCGGRGTDAEGSGDSGKAEEHGGDCGGRSTDAKGSGSGSRYGCLYCYNDGYSYGTCFCSGSGAGAGAGSYSYGYGGYSGYGGGDSYCDVHGYGYTYSCGHGCGGCYGYYRNRYDIPSVYRPRRRRRAMYYPAVGSHAAAQYGYATTASLYGAVYLLVPLYS